MLNADCAAACMAATASTNFPTCTDAIAAPPPSSATRARMVNEARAAE